MTLSQLQIIGLFSFFAASAITWSDANAVGPEPVLLWPQGAPGAQGEESVDQPSLRIYLPPQEKATGAGVVICPGGGYAILAGDHEGHQVAKWFNSHGVAAFVLQYRLGPKYHHPMPLLDAQRAVRTVRSQAKKFGLSSSRIGIMGFSAGGHLASTVATHFDLGQNESDDPVERSSCRPDFSILCYPVISMSKDFTHLGSRGFLLGENPTEEQLLDLSNEEQVTVETPPTFLFHTSEDASVSPENSLAYYQACLQAGVSAELHVYRNGPHGVGLAPGAPSLQSWKNRLLDWMKNSGFLAEVKRVAVEGTVHVDGKPFWGMITLVPEDSENKPSAFSMVSQGKFSIPAFRGAVVGHCHVEVRNLGALESAPSIESVTRLDDGNVTCEIVEGELQILDFNLVTKKP